MKYTANPDSPHLNPYIVADKLADYRLAILRLHSFVASRPCECRYAEEIPCTRCRISDQFYLERRRLAL